MAKNNMNNTLSCLCNAMLLPRNEETVSRLAILLVFVTSLVADRLGPKALGKTGKLPWGGLNHSYRMQLENSLNLRLGLWIATRLNVIIKLVIGDVFHGLNHSIKKVKLERSSQIVEAGPHVVEAEVLPAVGALALEPPPVPAPLPPLEPPPPLAAADVSIKPMITTRRRSVLLPLPAATTFISYLILLTTATYHPWLLV
ncbi:hypothetical protein SADUNF_Sadunf16G0009100 [Salix dunnii]|uniref:Uncharacterized protein n=1 Tax=Salix dunnii TaxID=1413687 RepID=A0A835J6C6_9ROSI|nr:hypothetical protein SADUNF_Sadunf16G0009100 [Salix dunnii]